MYKEDKKEIAVYIHVPFCISRCSYCDFYSNVSSLGVPQKYVDALRKELSFELNQYFMQNPSAVISSVYIGGGTPSLFSEVELNQICNTINNFTSIENIKEFTVECNPGDLTEELLSVFRNNGINRISLGIQSLNDKSLSFVKRRSSRIQNISAMNLLNAKWKGQFSFDFISGLPYETSETFMEGLKTAVELNPHHISMYQLVVEEETPLGKKILSEEIEYDFNAADSMWILGNEYLIKNSFEHYEISNYAREGFYSSHNLAYWNHKDYLGAGSGATGTVYFCDGTAVRKTGIKDIERYCNFWCRFDDSDFFKTEKTLEKMPYTVENIDKKDSEFEFFMMGLRKLQGIDSACFEQAFSEPVPQKFLDLFYEWKEKGLADEKIIKNHHYYAMNEKGSLLLNLFLEKLL